MIEKVIFMSDSDAQFSEFSKRMKRAEVPELAIETFRHYYEELLRGVTGLIPEEDILPVTDLPDVESFSEDLADIGRSQISKTIAIKLNGGLGTSMGLEQAKSLLKVKEGLSFLEIMARQALANEVPLLLMNSFATRDDTLSQLAQYPALPSGLPIDFLQHRIPKIQQRDLRPASSPGNPSLEWCPPGHGDVYTALVTSGTMRQLLDGGYRYCFISNADNLGAVIDCRILGHLVSTKSHFLMEVADRTESDRKGGHIARFSKEGGQLVLREAAQCSRDDWRSFQDIRRYTYFNTNNLWIDLVALNKLMKKLNGVLRLPMIRNRKTLDPRDPESTPVYQLETAMGAAISIFPEAAAVRVPRTRFSPVKTSLDLLAVRSDLTVLSPSFRVLPNPARSLGPFNGWLDERHYGHISALEARFPNGPPSLLNCASLKIQGDFVFGQDVTLVGDVELVNESDQQSMIPDGSKIEGVWSGL